MVSIYLSDVTPRVGQPVRAVVRALDAAGVQVIEVTHGDGLGGSSFNYGFSRTPEQELITLAAETARNAKIAVLMLPGVGVTDDIVISRDNGASVCRIATHCTEADVSVQHFGLASAVLHDRFALGQGGYANKPTQMLVDKARRYPPAAIEQAISRAAAIDRAIKGVGVGEPWEEFAKLGLELHASH